MLQAQALGFKVCPPRQEFVHSQTRMPRLDQRPELMHDVAQIVCNRDVCIIFYDYKVFQMS